MDGERNAGNAGNEVNVIFWGISSNIPENVLKHYGECRQTFRGISSNVPGNICVTQGNEDAGSLQDFI